MQIQLNTDHSISGSQRLTERVEAQVSHALGRFSESVTRVEIHLSDVNSDKGGAADKQCLMEARVRNHQPVSVTHEAGEFGLAVEGAAGKLARALDHLLGKFGSQRRQGQRLAKSSDTLLADEAPIGDQAALASEAQQADGMPPDAQDDETPTGRGGEPGGPSR